VEFGLFHLPAASVVRDAAAAEVYRNILEETIEAECLGFQTVWMAEHHYSGYGGHIPSVAVLGAAIAAHTSRIRIGSAAAILPLRDALRTAEEFAMLDVLSEGRLEMGVGRGFLPHEFARSNVDMAARGGRFEEALDIILRSWEDGPFSYTGRHYQLQDVDVFPKPVQRPHPPVWIAASVSQESFELAGARGFDLLINPYNRTPEELARGLAWYRQARAAAGHDPTTARITANQHLFAAENETTARETTRMPMHEYLDSVNKAFHIGNPDATHHLASDYESIYPTKVLFGTPERLVDRIKAWEAQGVTGLCLMTRFGSLDPRLARRSLQLFAGEVMPCFR
jgi:natural product biosynthesis luciferase-like monooxygenase protein